MWEVIGYTFLGLAGCLAFSGYIFLGISMCGLPHRCPEHGWNAQAVCFECEEKYD